jgi:hypothetical protein
MLTKHDPSFAWSSGNVCRRGFFRVGALTLGGLTLADVLGLRAESASSNRPRQKSVIMIHLSGGPSHLDMYDMKPYAPREYRGEFQAIRTNVPGMEICELMPMQAKIADRFAILRGVRLIHPLHTGNEFYSGYPWQENPRASVPGEARHPAVGSIVSRLRRGHTDIPPYVSVENHPDWERAYFAGVEHEPIRVGGHRPRETLDNMERRRDIGAQRLEGRIDLLRALDTHRHTADVNPAARGIDAFRARALEIVMSSRVRDAFDLEKEPSAIRARYGEGPFRHGPHPGRSLLMARRLVEAGVSVVTVGVHNWDTHRENFITLREQLPVLDKALHALLTDLEDRGLLGDVAVVMGGEFGRTPRIGDQTPDGRGHWPEAGFAWVAGGGLKTGQVIGATDARGEQVVGNPIRMQNVLATLYRVLGVDPSTTLLDHNGRPQYLLEDREGVAGLL